MTYYECTRGDRTQRLLCADLEADGTLDRIRSILPPEVRMVYSDPPWNPGNATYWRTHAGKARCPSWPGFMDAVTNVISECVSRGAQDVFVEQAVNPDHHAAYLKAMESKVKSLALVEQWTVYYKASAKLLPNVLFHHGTVLIATNPEGMADEPMTIRTCAGVNASPGSWVVDMCMGLGTTSRIAHYFDWNAVGVELNPKRLERTVKWLQKRGFEVTEC